MRRRAAWRTCSVIALFGITALLSSCATPGARLERFVTAEGLQRELVQGAGYRHVVIRNRIPAGGAPLDVYIEGDGVAFLTPTQPAPDPTSREFLMLHLLAEDPHAAIYLGRPCYLGLYADAGCQTDTWTRARFSQAVVDSLASVIATEMQRAHVPSVRLFGHSGGGGLAVLLTQQVPASGLITVGGNLDVDAWRRVHGYSPLSGSLEPKDVRLSAALADHATHYVGEHDTVVTPAILAAAVSAIGGRVIVVPGFTHQCCWARVWPQLLKDQFGD